MMKHTHHPHTLKIMIALLAAVVAVPSATHVLLGSVRNDPLYKSQVDSVIYKPWITSQRNEYRAKRRAFGKAIEACEYEKTTGLHSAAVTCPSFNDENSFKEYLEAEKNKGARKARNVSRNETRQIVSAITSLTSRQEALIRRFTRLGGCPSHLRGSKVYEECEKLMEKPSVTRTFTGFINPKASWNVRGITRNLTLNDRLRVNRESRTLNQNRQRNVQRPSIRSYRSN